MRDPAKYGLIILIRNLWDYAIEIVNDFLAPLFLDDMYPNTWEATQVNPPLFRSNISHNSLRQCPSCLKNKKVEHFHSTFTNVEFLYCGMCRAGGMPLIHYHGQIAPINERFVNRYQPYESSCRNYGYNQPPKSFSPTYYDVLIEEDYSNCADLFFGELSVTWETFANDSPKLQKQRRRKRKRSRKWQNIPWHYNAIPPSSDHERNMREKCERLWKHGYDEDLPGELLVQKSWQYFWEDYRKRTVLR